MNAATTSEDANFEEKETQEETETSKPQIKNYSSSSDSSSDNGKVDVETSLVAETSESSYQLESNISEDEISAASSSDLQASPPPRYFSARASK